MSALQLVVIRLSVNESGKADLVVDGQVLIKVLLVRVQPFVLEERDLGSGDLAALT
ncbi:MAG TPA: hypothetical protein VHT50_24245 [Mycobacterium sp.]|jgi:hypothetical protein|nr:hypothetical protein [Mycobacterium sp.]